jgi:hypothetical protein
VRNPFVRLLVLAGALLIALGAATQTSPHAATSSAARLAQLDAISDYRAETWRWQALMSRPRTPTLYTERRSKDTTYLRWVRDLWRGRAARAQRLAPNPPTGRQWLCIHRFERHPGQGWATRTGNGLLRRACRWTSPSSARTAASWLRRKGNREPLDRGRADVGWPSAPSGAVAASIRGRTRPAPAPDLGLIVVTAGAAGAPLRR